MLSPYIFFFFTVRCNFKRFYYSSKHTPYFPTMFLRDCSFMYLANSSLRLPYLAIVGFKLSSFCSLTPYIMVIQYPVLNILHICVYALLLVHNSILVVLNLMNMSLVYTPPTKINHFVTPYINVKLVYYSKLTNSR